MRKMGPGPEQSDQYGDEDNPVTKSGKKEKRIKPGVCYIKQARAKVLCKGH
jgi:hypothetical protein